MNKYIIKAKKRNKLPYANFVMEVNQFNWSAISNEDLKYKIYFCNKQDTPLVFSLIKEVILRCTGLTLFDTQISAARAMQQKHIAELPTGEGKTLAAVVTAAFFALQGKQVHILTFNDYLAKRDYENMREIFLFCGISIGVIDEKMNLYEKQNAYASPVLYLSAKQAGFDFLCNFLCTDKSQLLSISFQVAIIDEADSILIDEARIPLVIAGDDRLSLEKAIAAEKAVCKLSSSHVIYSKFQQNLWLTDSGISALENEFGIDSLYDKENEDLLSLLYYALEAHFLLERDEDYIVKGGQIYVIEQTTGRIAESRRFPDLLHQAVERKEGLSVSCQTRIYNSMPIQFFLLQYELLCGMTGTGKYAEKEIYAMYGITVDLIPPHIPCIRHDHSDEMYETEKDKTSAIISQIKQCYEKGQPVLLGTQSVAESEMYSQFLKNRNIPHQVLNAKYHEKEAEIISEAGMLFHVTISTNMAGRGVDIMLGGKHATEEEKNAVKEVGGLFVIGCGINRSHRIDEQLAGRAGRQGDPGESKFFISKEDVLIQNYDLYNCRKKRIHEKPRTIQKHEEGRDAEIRYNLERYAWVIEVQRRQITDYKNSILLDQISPTFFQTALPELYESYVNTFGKDAVTLAEKQLQLHFIKEHWADYLNTMGNLRNGIHLTVIGGLNPFDEYNKAAVAAFSQMETDIRQDVIYSMKTYKITKAGIDLQKAGLSGSTSTYTYMIDDRESQFVRLPFQKKDSH